jgi:multidrug efflux pump subunit AcrA (membrane-fusion protein)
MNNKILPIAALVGLVLATASIVRTQPRPRTEPPPATPARSSFASTVAAVGLIESRSENISLAAHIPGVVETVYVTVGDEVAAGAPLVKLDTRALEATRASRQAALAAARAQVARAEAAATEARRLLAIVEGVSDTRSVSAELLARRQGEAATSAAELSAAQASVALAAAQLDETETDLARSVITAPIAGRVLQVRIRRGEYAAAGPGVAPWLVIGDVSTLHVRVDIDESEAWRLRPEAPAIAQVRGNAALQTRATFVRFEPLVVPKQSLTGASTERVDTRVLQAVYRLDDHALPLFVGQQMDVFIEAAPIVAAANTTVVAKP